MTPIAALTRGVATWAATQPDVRAVALVGSHARGTPTAESDIDLIVLVDDVATRLDAREWVAAFGHFRSVAREDWGLVQSLRVVYDDGLEIEFGLALPTWATPPLDAATAAVICDGLVPVWDPDGIFNVTVEAAATDLDPPPLDEPVHVQGHDPAWTGWFDHEARRVASRLRSPQESGSNTSAAPPCRAWPPRPSWTS